MDSIAQFIEVRRLVQTLSRSKREGVLLHFVTTGGDAHDRDPAGKAELFPLGKECQPVHYRHHQIQYDDARPLLREKAQALLAIRGEHNTKAGLVEHGALDFPHIGIIFDHKNSSHSQLGSAPTPSTRFHVYTHYGAHRGSGSL